jgi:hypothetical protein
VARRGVLFAPVHLDTVVYHRPGFHYSPVTVIDVDVFHEHLFLRPSHCHYYFGDYYAVDYHDAGYLPAYSFHAARRGYDPIYARMHWQHRHDPGWARRVETTFAFRRDHVDARPPRTLSAQLELTMKAGGGTARAVVLAKPLDQVAKSGGGPIRFRRIEPDERKTLLARGKEIQGFRAERRKLETRPVAGVGEAAATSLGRTKVKMPSSPIAAKGGAVGKGAAPPSRPLAPEDSVPAAAPDKRAESGAGEVGTGQEGCRPTRAQVRPATGSENRPARQAAG